MGNRIKLAIVQMPQFGADGVKGKLTLPSKPYDQRNESGERWKHTDIRETIRKAREQIKGAQ